MNDMRTSSALRSLIEAAKSDGPGTVARSEVWASVSRSVAATVSGGGSGSALGSAGAAKTISLVTVFGGAVTVGLASAVLILQPMRSTERPPLDKLATAIASPAVAIMAPPVSPGPSLGRTQDALPSALPATAALAADGAHGPSSTAPSFGGSSPASGPPAANVRSVEARRSSALAAPPPAAPPPLQARMPLRASPPATPPTPVAFDPLAREAALLTQARAALAQGDPQAALRAVRAAMAVPGRQLVPEELSVESQALRALGRSHDADELTTELRTRYPDSALAR